MLSRKKIVITLTIIVIFLAVFLYRELYLHKDRVTVTVPEGTVELKN